jgi:uncharacterized protein
MKKQTGTLMLIITSECNLRCVYCYEKHGSKNVISMEIAKENITKVLLDDEKYEHINISLFGGEPFLYFERIKEICEWTWTNEWKVPYRFNFITNGTTFNDESKKWLIAHKDKISLVLSTDGNKLSQDLNRSNSFDKIDHKFFTNTWDDAQVKMTISEQSLPYLAEDVKFIHEMGFNFAECNLAMGIDWSDKKNIVILKREMEKLLHFYLDNKELIPAQIINMEIGACENKKIMHKWCGVGRELMTIDVDGKKYPCNFITPMSFNQEELNILMNTDFTNIREILDEECFNNCYLYPVCPTCYGADYTLTKSFKKKDRSICELMKIKAYYTAALKAHKIIKKDISNMSVEQKGSLHKTITAIKTINQLYGEV